MRVNPFYDRVYKAYDGDKEHKLAHSVNILKIRAFTNNDIVKNTHK
jgi:hypothetical protein